MTIIPTENELQRVQHLYVSIAKYLFMHPEYGIVKLRDPIKLADAKLHKLKPLILYGITADGLPIRWMSFSLFTEPKPIITFLRDAWTHAKGLRGQPDILTISHNLAAATPELAASMKEIGVEIRIAGAKEKSLNASTRTAQNACRNLRISNIDISKDVAETIERLCESAKNNHDVELTYQYYGKKRIKIERWLSLQVKPNPIMQIAKLDTPDWKTGPWLSSWENTVPPDRARHFHVFPDDGEALLLLGENAPAEFDSDEDKEEDEFCNYYGLPQVAKDIVACWPNSLADIAASIGVTSQQLKWFLDKKATLPDRVRYNLADLLGIEFSSQISDYNAVGPYVLIARKFTATQQTCSDLSHGGDGRPYEVIPEEGPTDPSWIYILLNTYGASPTIIMAPRGDKIIERLPALLCNYKTKNNGIKIVPKTLYQDIIDTCARACRDPKSNRKEMLKFDERNPDLYAESFDI